MKQPWVFPLMTVAAMLLAGCGSATRPANEAGPRSASEWRQKLSDALPLYGHRNWIVVADSAYPAQSRPGIETVVSGEDHVAVLQEVLAAVAAAKHIRPVVFTDREIEFVPEADAPGITAFRERLGRILPAGERNPIEHEQIIQRLDEAGQTFHVLIIKTNMALPYTSVFLQLDCGYWAAGAEQRMRQAIGAAAKQ